MRRHLLHIVLFASILVLFACKKEKSISESDQSHNAGNQKIPNTTKSVEEVFDPSYVHVVYFWLKDPSDQEHRERFEKSLRTFLDASLYAKTQFIGHPPAATRDVVDDSFTYNLVVTFASAADQEAYQEETAHKTFIAEASSLWDKVIVYDAIRIDN